MADNKFSSMVTPPDVALDLDSPLPDITPVAVKQRQNTVQNTVKAPSPQSARPYQNNLSSLRLDVFDRDSANAIRQFMGTHGKNIDAGVQAEAGQKMMAITKFLGDNGIIDFSVAGASYSEKQGKARVNHHDLVCRYDINGYHVSTVVYAENPAHIGETTVFPPFGGSTTNSNHYRFEAKMSKPGTRGASVQYYDPSVEETLDIIRIATGLDSKGLDGRVKSDVTNTSSRSYKYISGNKPLIKGTFEIMPDADIAINPSPVGFPATLSDFADRAKKNLSESFDIDDVVSHYMTYGNAVYGSYPDEHVNPVFSDFNEFMHRQVVVARDNAEGHTLTAVDVHDVFDKSVNEYLGITEPDADGIYVGHTPIYAENIINAASLDMNMASSSAIKSAFADAVRQFEDNNWPLDFAQTPGSMEIRGMTTPFHTRSKAYTPAEQASLDVMRDEFSRLGADVKNIELGEHGIVKIDATSVRTHRSTASEIPFTAYIGPLFTPNENGLITTDRYGIPNTEIIPGYIATLDDKADGKTIGERTRVTGFDDIMDRNIRFAVRQCMDNREMLAKTFINADKGFNGPASVKEGDIVIHNENSLYRSYSSDVYVMRYPEHHFEMVRENMISGGMSEKDADACVKAIESTRRIKFADRFADTANTVVASTDRLDIGKTFAGENLDVISSKGQDRYIFDTSATVNGKNVGSTRFLTSDATVDETGHLHPGKSTKSPIFELPFFKGMENSSVDRAIMSFTQTLDCTNLVDNAGIAYINANGWNLDDGIIVSKKFADTHKIIADGKSRPLSIQDKISTIAGNKGVISLVVDPDSEKQKNDPAISGIVRLFNDNPDLDCVMSPYSPISRTNMTTAVTALSEENHTDLTLPDGSVIKGGLALHQHMIVTDMPADVKSHDHISDREDGAEDEADDETLDDDYQPTAVAGRARGLSNQVIANIIAQGGGAIVKEQMTGDIANLRFVQKLQQMVGVNMDADGNLSMMDDKDIDEKGENIIAVDKADFDKYHASLHLTTDAQALRSYMKNEMKNAYGHDILSDDGLIKLPFEVKHKYAPDRTTHFVPMMSQFTHANSVYTTNFTPANFESQYKTLIMSAYQYSNEADPAKKQKFVDDAQKAVNSIETTVTENFLGKGKYSVYRTRLLRSNVMRSATKVWSEDPRLDLDTVGISKTTAKHIGIKSSEADPKVVVWRDPVKDTMAHLMRVHIYDDDESCPGLTVNPMIGPQFEGDFDGDSIALCRFSPKTMKALESSGLTMESQVINTDVGADNKHPLFITENMDVASNAASDDIIADRLSCLNQFGEDMQNPYADAETKKFAFDTINKDAKTLLNGIGTAYLSFDSPQALYDSMMHFVDQGAKGSPSKAKDAMTWAGYDVDDKGKVTEIADKTGWEEDRIKKNEGTFVALGAKAEGTARAGYIYQLGLRAFSGSDNPQLLSDFAKLTSPYTQGLLQAKHNPADATNKLNIVCNVLQPMWDGKNINVSFDDTGRLHIAEEKMPGAKTSLPINSDKWKYNFKLVSLAMVNEIDSVAKTPADVFSTDAKTRQKAVDDGFAKIMNPSALDRIAHAMSDDSGNIVGLSDLANSERHFRQNGRDVSTPNSALLDRMVYTSGVAESDIAMHREYSNAEKKVRLLISAAEKLENLYGSGTIRKADIGEIYEKTKEAEMKKDMQAEAQQTAYKPVPEIKSVKAASDDFLPV